MKKILTPFLIWLALALPASAQNFLRDNGEFQSVVTGTSSGQLLANIGGNLGPATTIPNGVTATTQAAGDTSTKVATDAFVASAITNDCTTLGAFLVGTGSSAQCSTVAGSSAVLNGSLSINPTVNSNNYGFSIAQAGAGVANACLNANSGLVGAPYNCIVIIDNYSTSQSQGLYVELDSTGSSATGGVAGYFASTIGGSASRGTFGAVGVTSYANVTTNYAGGTTMSPLGASYGISVYGLAIGNNMHLNNVTGGEINYAVIGTSTDVNYVSGLQIVANDNHGVHGTTYDAVLSLSKKSTAIGANEGILFSNANGGQPVATTGVLIESMGSATVTEGIDFSSYTFTSNLLNFPNFVISQPGSITAGPVFSANSASSVASFTATGGTHIVALYTQASGGAFIGPSTSDALSFLTNNAVRGSISATGVWNIGVTGTLTGSMGFSGATTGTATLTAQATAGSPTLTLPNTTGTFADGASAPLVLSATTGNLTCPTCATTTSGGAISGAAPIAVSSAGAISITGVAGQVLAGSTPAFTATPTLGVVGSTVGSLAFANTTSGTETLTPATGALGSGIATLVAGTYNLVGDSLTQTLTNKTIGAATLSGTISGGGNQINNVIVGASTPLAGAFTTLASGVHTLTTAPAANTSNDGAILIDATAAPSSGNQQYSPRLRLSGQGWKTTATAGSEQVDWVLENQPVQGTTTPTTNLAFSSQINGAGYNARLTLEDIGNGLTVIFNGAGPTQFALEDGGTAYGAIYVDNTQMIVGSTSSVPLKLEATNTLGITINNSGAVWVGSTNVDEGANNFGVQGQFFMPSITTSSAAQTGTVCWTTGTGKFTVDTTVACLTSLMLAKNITEHLSPSAALEIVSRLDPFAFRYKSGYGDSGHYEQFGLGAEEVALVDERMVGRDAEGTLQGVRYQELTAVLAGAIQKLKADNDNLKTEVRHLKKDAPR